MSKNLCAHVFLSNDTYIFTCNNELFCHKPYNNYKLYTVHVTCDMSKHNLQKKTISLDKSKRVRI